MFTQTPLVTIGMPVFNSEQYIAAAISSILEQSHTELELTVSDNASTDGTGEICREFEARDSRVRYIRNRRNVGASDNYNLVLQAAKSPYFKWASSNDLCHPNFLAACVEALEKDATAVLAYPQTVLFTEEPESGETYVDHLELDIEDPCLRFLRFIERLKLNNVMNGVCRTEQVKSCPIMKAYVGSDLVTTAAMTLLGKLVEIPGEYFFRRMDEKSATQLQGEEAVFRHYDPSNSKKMVFQLWRLHFEYFSAVRSSPITASQKFFLGRKLLRHMVWARRSLSEDVWISLRRLIAPGHRFTL